MRVNRTLFIIFLFVHQAVPYAVEVASAANTGRFESISLYRFDAAGNALMLEWNSMVDAPEKPELKSKTRARLHSAGYTAVPILLARGISKGFRLSDQSGTSMALLTAGIIAGPSAGSIYADDWDLAKRSMVLRSVSTTLIVAGYFIHRADDDLSKGVGLAMQIIGGTFLTGHALYDIIFLSAHSVDYYNMQVRLKAGMTLNSSMPAEWSEWTGNSPRSNLKQLPEFKIRLFF